MVLFGSTFKISFQLCNNFQADMDEMASEARLSNEKASKAMVDAARLADELRCEQELAQELERSHKVSDAQVKDMQSQLDDAEINALKGGKTCIFRCCNAFADCQINGLSKLPTSSIA